MAITHLYLSGGLSWRSIRCTRSAWSSYRRSYWWRGGSMLRQLSASDPRFKTIDFRPGLNVLVADTTGASSDTDSRNSAGKSSMIELLHFLLGSSGDTNSLPAHRALRSIDFRLQLDWPGVPDRITVE